MPEIRVNTPKKPKKEVAPSYDSNEVVSAYSEEGQRRIKKSRYSNKKFIIAFIVMIVITISAAIAVILLFENVIAK